MNRYCTSLLTLLLCAWCGCSKPNEIEDPEQKLIVQAYLVPGKDAQIALRRTLLPGHYYEGLEDTVSGATVELSVDDQKFVLSEDPLQPGTYTIAGDIMPVEFGATYHLTATFEVWQVRASTTVPFKSEITAVSADTITYFQYYGDLFGDLVHPGEFSWTRSENAAGYIIIVEAVEVSSLPISVEPLTADLDTLLSRRQRLEGQVSQDSLQTLERQIQELRDFFEAGISRVQADGDTIRYLRDRHEEDWDELEAGDWTEGKKWRKRREKLFDHRFVNYWIPADSLRSDFWWLGVRFEGEYQITLQAADQNYFDYFTTYLNGLSGNDGDQEGPLFHVEGGTGVFGSYAEDSRRVVARRGEEGPGFKIVEE